MEVVRYKPSDAVRWFQSEADRLKTDAKASGKAATENPVADFGKISESIRHVAGAMFNLGKSAYAELAHMRANASEYVFLDDHLDIVTGSSIKSISYSSVRKITMGKNDRAVVEIEKGQFTIKPFAHIVAGPLKIPIGWQRNGLEAPYHLILEELAARSKVEITI